MIGVGVSDTTTSPTNTLGASGVFLGPVIVAIGAYAALAWARTPEHEI